MGYKEISLNLPTDYTAEELREKIGKNLKRDSSCSYQSSKGLSLCASDNQNDSGAEDFSYQINKKSLDARKKNDVHWQIRALVTSKTIKGPSYVPQPPLNIPYQKRNKKIVVVGSGPAGFFSAFVLQKAGFDTTIIERGADVIKRAEGIKAFEKTGDFNSVCNYAFGEGGAGTFSDGKLTSRTKRIALEKEFILSSYVEAGANEEIKYMAHPHLGSDNLIRIVKNLREKYQDIGGKVLFETSLDDLVVKNGRVVEAVTNKGVISADEFLIAPGHSAHDTYRMLIRNGVKFRTKNFAIGCRVEHPQEVINKAQWGCESLPGVKAAEYRLTSKGNGNLPVYTFCMCPGGIIVNASAYNDINIVNGMSLYNRAGKFANAACVAGVNLDNLMQSELSPLQALDWLESLERKFNSYSGFKAPYCSVLDFINKKVPNKPVESSYSLGLTPAPLWELLSAEISCAIRAGLKDFSNKIKDFDTGNIMGLETKTSSPIQVIREKNGLCTGFENLYIIGEGSGYSGGIISSAVDGIKAAINIIN